ncbi:GNAT family N-acetyltransferase [Niveispirillum irakense]|uniref:GNAT family N-acetyltransferase n=1 Tax=Niveispirillum irakense TaxID=34011 RepID=UPI00040DABF5|nr:GNAT family N-acetyltransferase [Niveispirillum irakense]
MPIIRLMPGDEERLDAYLARHPSTSLFLRSNLRRAGFQDEGKAFQARYAAMIGADGSISGVVAHAWNGNLLVQAVPDQAIPLAASLAEDGDRPVAGIIGPLPAAQAVRSLFPHRELASDGTQDLFDLPLAELRIPHILGERGFAWRRAGAADFPLLTAWRRAYGVELLNIPDDAALATRSATEIATWGEAGEIFLLVDPAGEPIAMAVHNARIPDTVQIGGVWTPPALRGRGYARAAVAVALLAARNDGALVGVLFTGKQNEQARRAYLALGFRSIGDYGILLFR